MWSKLNIRAVGVVVGLAAVVAVGFLAAPAEAGTVEPPAEALDASGKPVPTMPTLEEIFRNSSAPAEVRGPGGGQRAAGQGRVGGN